MPLCYKNTSQLPVLYPPLKAATSYLVEHIPYTNHISLSIHQIHCQEQKTLNTSCIMCDPIFPYIVRISETLISLHVDFIKFNLARTQNQIAFLTWLYTMQQRQTAWFASSLKSRLQYLGPSPGLPSLDDQSSQENSLDPSAGPTDAFCLLVLDPEQVQIVTLST